jgi:hypothetical protein
MLENILGHLPTTLLGLLGAAGSAAIDYIQAGGTITLGGILRACAIAIFGALVKTK